MQRPPSNRKPTFEEILAHRGYLIGEIHVIEPEVIMTLGKTALESLLEQEIPTLSPYIGRIREFDGYKLIPNYHPSALLRSDKYTKKFEEVFQIVRDQFND